MTHREFDQLHAELVHRLFLYAVEGHKKVEVMKHKAT